jgi:PAS domain S-box-containing protein
LKHSSHVRIEEGWVRGNAIVLIVDDDVHSRKTLEAILASEGHDLSFASSGPEALAQAEALRPDVVLLDVMMPGMDGYTVCRTLRANPRTAEVPVIMVTALDDRESRLRGIEEGSDDFLSKPFDPTELRARVRATIQLNRYRRLIQEREKSERLIELAPDGILVVDQTGAIRLANPAIRTMLGADMESDLLSRSMTDFISPEHAEACGACLHAVLSDAPRPPCIESMLLCQNGDPVPVEVTAGRLTWEGRPASQVVVRDITERKRAEEELRRAHTELEQAYDSTLEGWSRALELRDLETEGHTRRVVQMTIRLAVSLGITGDDLAQIRRGALLHDVGKMGIPDRVLLKPGPLTDEEWTIIRRHPTYAYEMLLPIEYLRPALDIPYCHHERWDGSGYPRGLSREEIPLAARIFSVVDSWDAMRNVRVYSVGRSADESELQLQAGAGSQFDPAVVQAFLTLIAGSARD